jgi:hypothetical protein
MGIHKSGAYFQNIMSNTVLRNLINKIAVIYIDDLLVAT